MDGIWKLGLATVREIRSNFVESVKHKAVPICSFASKGDVSFTFRHSTETRVLTGELDGMELLKLELAAQRISRIPGLSLALSLCHGLLIPKLSFLDSVKTRSVSETHLLDFLLSLGQIGNAVQERFPGSLLFSERCGVNERQLLGLDHLSLGLSSAPLLVLVLSCTPLLGSLLLPRTRFTFFAESTLNIIRVLGIILLLDHGLELLFGELLFLHGLKQLLVPPRDAFLLGGLAPLDVGDVIFDHFNVLNKP